MLRCIVSGFQLMGLTLVGLCFFSGVFKGDYGQEELVQFVGGSLMFYLGIFLRKKLD